MEGGWGQQHSGMCMLVVEGGSAGLLLSVCASTVMLLSCLGRDCCVAVAAAVLQARHRNPKTPELWLAAIRTEQRAGNTKAAEALLAKGMQVGDVCAGKGFVLLEGRGKVECVCVFLGGGVEGGPREGGGEGQHTRVGA